jgi:hypothetical protein
MPAGSHRKAQAERLGRATGQARGLAADPAESLDAAEQLMERPRLAESDPEEHGTDGSGRWAC